MYKLVILTDPENALGFRLAGVDVEEAASHSEAREKLIALINNDTSGIIAINESFMSAIDDRTAKRIETVYRPIVVPLPFKEKLIETGEGRRSYLSKLVRRAVGFDITLKR